MSAGKTSAFNPTEVKGSAFNIKDLDSIAFSISEENAKLIEEGEAQFTIEPVMVSGESLLVVFVNGQPVYAPSANNRMETYSNCFEECERYMNSY